MTETKTEVVETLETSKEQVEQKKTPVIPVPKKVGPNKDLIEENKKLQGEKEIKKKIKFYNEAECLKELQRLDKAGHQSSKYYKTIKSRALSFHFTIVVPS